MVRAKTGGFPYIIPGRGAKVLAAPGPVKAGQSRPKAMETKRK